MKKFLLLIVAVLTVFSFAACEKDGDKDSGKDDSKGNSVSDTTKDDDTSKDDEDFTIEGTWTSAIDFTDMLSEAFVDGDMEEYVTLKNITMDMIWEFDKKGNVESYFDEKSVEKAFENVADAICDGMEEYMEDMAELEGMTLEDLAEAMEYDSADEMVDELCSSFKNDMVTSAEDFIDTFKGEGEYILDGDKLYIGEDSEEAKEDDSYLVVEVKSNDTFNVTEIENPNEYADGLLVAFTEDLDLPIKFEK